jgi:hypothetical protein
MPRKVFVAGEILTAADVNTNLMDQAVMVFDDSAARGSAIPSPSEGMLTYLKDTDALEKYTNAWVPAAPGKILQVVQTVKSDSYSVSLGSGATDTQDIPSFSASITPSSASSKVLIFASTLGSAGGGADGIFLRRNGSNLTASLGDSVGSRTRITSGVSPSRGDGAQPSNIVFLDSPATTSATTYSFRLFNARENTQTLYVNITALDASRGYTGISTITLMEVAG